MRVCSTSTFSRAAARSFGSGGRRYTPGVYLPMNLSPPVIS